MGMFQWVSACSQNCGEQEGANIFFHKVQDTQLLPCTYGMQLNETTEIERSLNQLCKYL